MNNDVLLGYSSRNESGSVEPALSKKEERLRKKKKNAARAKGLSIASLVFGGLALGITVIRILLLPLCLIVGLFSAFLVWVYMMMGGALMLAMSALVYPLLLIFIIIAAVVIIGFIALAELVPSIFGILSIILAVIASRVRKKATKSARRKKVLKIASFVLSIAGTFVAVVAEPLLLVPSLLLFSPVLLIFILAMLFILQMFGIAIA